MTKETQTAVNTAKIDFLTKVFDKHCQDQNGSMNRMADSIEGLKSSIDIKFEKHWPKSLSILIVILVGLVSSLITILATKG